MHLCRERDRTHGTGCHIDTSQLAALRQYQALTVRCPLVPRQYTQCLAPTCDHRIDRVHQHAFGAGLDVAQPERSTRPVLVSLELDQAIRDVPCKGEPSTIRRNLGHCAAAAGETTCGGTYTFAIRDVENFAALQLQATQLHRAGQWLLVRHGRHRHLVIHIFAVCTHCRRAATRNERYTSASIAMIHDQATPTRTHAALTAAATAFHDNELSIGCPRRLRCRNSKIGVHRARL